MARKHSTNALELRFRGAKKLKTLIKIVSRNEAGIMLTGNPEKGYKVKLWPASGLGCDWSWLIYDLYKAGFKLPEKYRKIAKEIDRYGGI